MVLARNRLRFPFPLIESICCRRLKDFSEQFSYLKKLLYGNSSQNPHASNLSFFAPSNFEIWKMCKILTQNVQMWIWHNISLHQNSSCWTCASIYSDGIFIILDCIFCIYDSAFIINLELLFFG